jgi:hypothetical protein
MKVMMSLVSAQCTEGKMIGMSGKEQVRRMELEYMVLNMY